MKKIVPIEDFIKAYIRLKDVKLVAQEFDMTITNVYNRIRSYREKGIDLPLYPKEKGATINVDKTNELIQSLLEPVENVKPRRGRKPKSKSK